MSVWPHQDSLSRKLYERAERVIPGGITRITPWQTPFPIYASHGEGAYVVDVDGTRRLDLSNNYASLIHGHAHPAVVEAIQKRVALGTAFALPTEAEVELAETLCARVDSFERVRFSNSGSEAVMCAIKAARAFTGRPKIVKVEGSFHGSYDYAEVSIDSSPANWGNEPRSVAFSSGTPRGVTDDVIVVPFNNPEAVRRIIRANADQIAGVLLDARPSYLGFIQISKAFADVIAEEARAIGALVILDEVVTLRLHYGGAQTQLGLRPDLTVLGKIIGGGFPVGAIAGPDRVMSIFDHRKGKPPLPWSGTFTGNPVSMTAGRVTLDLFDHAAIDRISALGDYVRREVTKLFEKNNFPMQITGVSSMFKLVGHRRKIVDYRSAYSEPAEARLAENLQRLLITEGYIVSRGFGFISTVTTQADVEGFVDAVGRCLPELADTTLSATA